MSGARLQVVFYTIEARSMLAYCTRSEVLRAQRQPTQWPLQSLCTLQYSGSLAMARLHVCQAYRSLRALIVY